jgi:DNA-binding HxlR family transcriptional regulator
VPEGYNQYFCPISRGSEIFATRWTPVIVRNLLLGANTFSELQMGAPGIPRSLLTERLRWLEHLGLIAKRPNPERKRGWLYEMTPAGHELEPVVEALGNWGAKWLDAAPTELEPAVLLWAICKAMDREQMPEERVVVQFNLRDVPKQRFWILVQRPEPEVCPNPPGFDNDLVINSDTEWLAKWYMGRISLGSAMHARRITIEGPRHLVREVSKWGGVTPFAGVAPANA